LFLHRLKLNDKLVYYGAFLNVSIKNSAASREDLVLNQIPCYLFMFNNLIHGYSGVL